MSKNHFGNNLLYLLSEKKSLSLTKFKTHMNYLNEKNTQKSQYNNTYWMYDLAKNLNSLAYLDMGVIDNQTFVQISPPTLLALPFIKPTFLLTGARSPKFLKIIKSSLRNHSEFEIKTKKNFPDTVIITSENIENLENSWKNTLFQGNTLSSYIKIYKKPIAWHILESIEDLLAYRKSLESKYIRGEKSEIKSIYDINTLQFKSFYSDNPLKDEFSLIKIFHSEKFYTYYLFSISNKRVKVNLDWGKFLIASQSKRCFLTYNKSTFELTSYLGLPLAFERGLALLSGFPPTRKDKDKNICIFSCVPYKIAILVAQKLEQEIHFIEDVKYA